MGWGCQALRWSVSKCFSQESLGGELATATSLLGAVANSPPVYARIICIIRYMLGFVMHFFYFFLYFFHYEQSYLSKYWTDFHDFFHQIGRYLRGFFRSGPVFLIPQGMMPWQPILWQNYLTPTFIALAFWSWMGDRNFLFQKSNWQSLVHSL